MDFLSNRFKIDRLENDISRLPRLLNRAIDALPSISAVPASDLDEAEIHAPLFRFLKVAESVAARIHELTSTSTSDAAKDLPSQLTEVCSVLTARIDDQINKITKADLATWAGEARVFMLRESGKRVGAVAEDMVSPSSQKVAITAAQAIQMDETAPLSLGGGFSTSSAFSSGESTASTPQPIPGRHLAKAGMDPCLSSAPKLRNIIRLGSYQNAAFFSGSPVAVRPKKKTTALAAAVESVAGAAGSIPVGMASETSAVKRV